MLIIILKSLCLALAIGLSGVAVSSTVLFSSYIKDLTSVKPESKITSNISWIWLLTGLFWAGFYFLCEL